MPDKYFKDQRLHHYPASLDLAKKWLNNDSDLSINLGIASHYITDSFVAPHNIFNESSKDHHDFEKQVEDYYPSINCIDKNFSIEDLKIGTVNAKDWNIWLKTKDKQIPQREKNQAAEFLTSIILKKLNTTCNKNKTEIIETSYFNTTKIILISVILIAGLYFLKR